VVLIVAVVPALAEEFLFAELSNEAWRRRWGDCGERFSPA